MKNFKNWINKKNVDTPIKIESINNIKEIIFYIEKFWLSENFDFEIKYEYFEKTDNVIINIYVTKLISNRQDNMLGTKNNINDFIDIILFFNENLNKNSQIIILPRNGMFLIRMLIINNYQTNAIKEICKILNILDTSKKYNL